MKRLLTYAIILFNLVLVTITFTEQPTFSQTNIKNKETKVQKEEFLPKPNKSNKKSSNKSSESSIIGTFFKSILVLTIFILIAYYILKKIKTKKINPGQSGTDGAINILKTSSLTSNKAIQIVEISNKIYILGIGDQMISVLNIIDETKEIEEIKNQCNKDSYQLKQKNFKDLFYNYIKPKNNLTNKILSTTNNKQNFFNEQRNKLKELKNKF